MNRTATFAVFGLVLTLITGLLHAYVWARLVRDPQLPAPWDKVATVVIVALALLIPATMVLVRTVFPNAPRALLYPAFVWMGVVFILFTVLVALDAFKALGLLALKLWGAGDALEDPARRAMLAQATAAAAAVTSGTLSLFAINRMANGPLVKTMEVKLARLPKALDGFTVAQLTDIHLGTTIGQDYAQMLVDRTQAIGADLIAITGDLVDGSPEELGPSVMELQRLKAKHGICFVTGNHEYYAGVDEWLRFLTRMGVRVLRNEHVEIEENGARLVLAGVDDFNAAGFGRGHGANTPQALLGVDPALEVLMLAHQPRAIEEAAPLGVGLMLSGHTHGGQIWPWNHAVKLQQPYVEGLYQHAQSQIYVSPGTGYWGPPMRLGTRAEITRVVLRSAAA